MVMVGGAAMAPVGRNVVNDHRVGSSQTQDEMNGQGDKEVAKLNGWRKLEKLEM
jgi:hypothetical protein